MKICHIITRLIVGGAQENTLLTCEGLAARGHQVTLISGPETGPEGSLWERADDGGYELVTVDSLRRNVRPVAELRCLVALRRLLRDSRFDVVHTHSSKAGILGRYAAAAAQVPIVVHTIHGMSFNRTQSASLHRLYRMLERRAARKTHAIIAVADAMIEQSVRAGIAPAEKFTTIRSGIETSRFAPDPQVRAQVRADWKVRDDDVVIGTIARLFSNKGYEDLLEALPRVARRCPNARLVWVGDGANRQEYVRQVEQLGLGNRLHLTGLVRPEDVPRLLNGFDVLVHASRWEGLPRAVVQALLMEVPVVSYDNDGAPEVVIQDCTGELVPFGDVRRLADGIIRLAVSSVRRRRLGQEGRRRCLKEFDHHRMVERIESIYHRLHSSDG
ncbi:MAG: glycosyltransferase family 4 protein [Phycisphaerae bacterium]|nr:glycosyltransferase family 4 protein [Phycisphaerae bacterium]